MKENSKLVQVIKPPIPTVALYHLDSGKIGECDVHLIEVWETTDPSGEVYSDYIPIELSEGFFQDMDCRNFIGLRPKDGTPGKIEPNNTWKEINPNDKF